MIKIGAHSKNNYQVIAAFKGDKFPSEVIEKNLEITEFASKSTIYIYLGDRKEYNIELLKGAIKKIVTLNKKDLDIHSKTFINNEISLKLVVHYFTDLALFYNEIIWNMKTGENKPKSPKQITLLDAAAESATYKKSKMLIEEVNFVRSQQAKAPNHLNAPGWAKDIQNYLKESKNLSVQVLTKKEIIANKMGLLLAVNAASQYEPRVVVIEYNGNPSSKEKQALIGKGIMFDSGGINLKLEKSMLGMKYDMSATAIIAAAMKAMSFAKPKINVVAVLCLTDNAIGSTATFPDSVVTSMNGMSVEINNTDAEGRLVLADGITYAIRKAKATKILDMSTLTGAISVALGSTYTGIWASNDQEWNRFERAAKNADELVWRMPFHDDFIQFMKKSPVADLRNTDYSGKGGSASAAMFLKAFTEKLPYLHLDIAGTASIDGDPKGVMVKTLYELMTQK